MNRTGCEPVQCRRFLGLARVFFATDRMPLLKDAIEDSAHLIVPVICIYEVYKKLRRDRGEADASRAALAMQTGRVVTLDFALAIAATTFSLAMADSLNLRDRRPVRRHAVDAGRTFQGPAGGPVLSEIKKGIRQGHRAAVAR